MDAHACLATSKNVPGVQGVGGIEAEEVGEVGERGEGVFGSGTGRAEAGEIERLRVMARRGSVGRIVRDVETSKKGIEMY